MTVAESRLHELGFALAPRQKGRPFDAVKVVGDLAFVSGHGPTDHDGALTAVGRVGQDVTLDEGHLAARLTAANCLASLKESLGDLDRVIEVVKVLVFVNSAPDFFDQPLVANGFTNLLVEVFGPKGRHARSAIGVSALPNNQAVEVEMIVRIKV